MRELERELRELGRHVELPPTPDLASAVRARLEAGERPRRWRPRRRALLVALAVLAVVGGTLVASPDARTAVLRLLRLEGATVRRVETLPPVTQPPSRDAFGQIVTLGEAREQAPYLRVPAALGPPDSARLLGTPPPEGSVSLVYEPRPGLPASRETGVGLVVTEFRARLAYDLVEKMVGMGSQVERVRVGRDRGLWISGEPHVFLYRGADGEPRSETLRVAGNTLLWEHDGLLLRLEGDIDRAEATRIARSVP